MMRLFVHLCHVPPLKYIWKLGHQEACHELATLPFEEPSPTLP